MQTIEAIYEGGVFRPINPVALPERSHVQLQIVNGAPSCLDADDGMEEIYQILDARVDTGITDLAARQDEHQP